MTQWEYRTKWCKDYELEETLADYGSNGWECFNVYHDPNPASSLNTRLYFKRPL